MPQIHHDAPARNKIARPIRADADPGTGTLKRPIRADFIGIYQATAAGIRVNGRHAPILALCRALIDAGHDPATPLEAYRGTTLCLRVRSIGEGAKLTVVETTSDGKPRFASFHAFPLNVLVRPPVAQTGAGVLEEPSSKNNMSLASLTEGGAR